LLLCPKEWPTVKASFYSTLYIPFFLFPVARAIRPVLKLKAELTLLKASLHAIGTSINQY